jgi:hypothetical protein
MTDRMVMVRDMQTDTDMPLSLSGLHARSDRYRVLVWDEAAAEYKAVTRSEAALGLFRYAGTPGPGTPACAVWTERAIGMAGDDLMYNRKLRRAAGS